MKTILFGGSGLLGSVFLKKYPEIISVGRTAPLKGILNEHIDLPHLDAIKTLDNLEFDNVIFLIGNSNHHEINNSSTMGLDYNVIPLKKALHYFQNRNINKFVCFTTILLYGTECTYRPVSENDKIFPYQNDYVFSKYLAEQLVEFYKTRVPIINVRTSNIYGATTLDRPDLVPTLIKDSLTKQNPTVWSTKPERDFIFAEDTADAVMKLLETDFKGTINIGSGKTHSVKQICDIISELSEKIISSLDKPVNGPMRFQTDISYLKSNIDWQPQHSLKQGITKAFEMMKSTLKV